MSRPAGQQLQQECFALSCEQTYGLWLRSGDLYNAARDFYSRLCLSSAGPVIAMERQPALLAEHLGPQMPELKSVSGAPRGDSEGGLLDQGWRDVWSSYHSLAPVPLIVAPFGGVEHALDMRALAALFQAFHKNLEPGGKAVFDLHNWAADRCRPNGVQRLVADVQWPDGCSTVMWESLRSANPSKECVECCLAVETVLPMGSVKARRYLRLLLASLPPPVVMELAGKAGFPVARVYGGFSFEPLEENSPVQLWLLQKGGQGVKA